MCIFFLNLKFKKKQEPNGCGITDLWYGACADQRCPFVNAAVYMEQFYSLVTFFIVSKFKQG